MSDLERTKTHTEQVMIRELIDCGCAPEDAGGIAMAISDALRAAGFSIVPTLPTPDDVRERVANDGLVEHLTRQQFELDWCDNTYGQKTPDEIEKRWEQTRAAYRHRVEVMLSAIRSGDKLPGGVMVPEEATVEMLAAWYQHKSGFHFHDEPPPADTSCTGAYRAMLAAAKEPRT